MQSPAQYGRPRFRRRTSVLATAGLGQLTLVEHALCPIDARSSLVPNLVFDTGFFLTDSQRHTKFAQSRVFCPLGLSAADEFYLWGLLALTFVQRCDDGLLCATPHYLLRQLGLIDQRTRRGGRQYQQFAAAIERLSFVRYKSDRFYDPVRAEHRAVSCGFLSYSLPLDPDSSRAWRIAWDPIFFELTRPIGGHFWFDLATYRELDPACRRLFLFACKVFSRRTTTPRLPLRHLGERILGFAPSLATRDLKAKVRRCVVRLAERDVVMQVSDACVKHGRGEYSVTLRRGAYFDRPPRRTPTAADESPLHEPLLKVGFDSATIARLLRQYSPRLLQEWADVTLAALERFGTSFFKRSPQAYFVDNVKHAAAGMRTPPDWWHDVRKSEQRDRQPQDGRPDPTVNLFDRIAAELNPSNVRCVAAPESPVAAPSREYPEGRTSSASKPQPVGAILSRRRRS